MMTACKVPVPIARMALLLLFVPVSFGAQTDVPCHSVQLPSGCRRVTRYDAIAKSAELLADDASGSFAFSSPDSRAGLVHFRRIDP